MPTVIDDATLLAVLTRRAGPGLLSAAERGEVLTTGSWCYRLHRALHDPESDGSLSAAAADLSLPARQVLFDVLDDLPPEIIVPGPRLVVPVAGALRLRRRVNHLTAEALAVALISQADIRVRIDAKPLRDACQELNVALTILAPTA